MAPTSREVGLKIKKIREAHKPRLSRYALAKRAGISRAYLGKLEKGRAKASLDMLQKLAHALGVPLTELLS
jgi:transcriptional regulator with XRE-family HTH domain